MQAVMLAGVALLGVTQTGAQVTQQSTDDPFAAYHEILSAAADKVVVAYAQQPDLGHLQNTSPSLTAPAPASIAATNRLTAGMARVQQLRPVIDPILREEGIPIGLAAIVLVESDGQPFALSRKGARGLWQLMPDTARRYGLIVTGEGDERLDARKSTRAAARYLRDLYAHFGDWQLALAAYNAGEDVVQHAITRQRTTDFLRLSSSGSLPSETRKYVPAVMNTVIFFGDSKILTTQSPSASRVIYADQQLRD